MTTSFPTLLPCPFCGIDPIFSARGMNAGATTVECRNLNCPVMPATGPLSHAEASTAWNTRASPQLQSTEAVERLRAAIEAERRRWFCSGPDCEPFDHGRDEGFEFALKAFDAAITALTSPAVVEALERKIVREKCPYVLPPDMRGMQCPNCDCAEGKSGSVLNTPANKEGGE